MMHTHQRSRRSARSAASLFLVSLAVASVAGPNAAFAQNSTAPTVTPAGAPANPGGKRALTVDDYTKWRSINGSSISGDGKWVAYVLSYTNTAPADAKPVMHLVRLDNNQDLEIPNASSPAFSSDSRWVAYQVDPNSGGRGGRGGRGGGAGAPAGATPGGQGTRGGPPAQPRRVELRNLETGAIQSWQDMQSFAFAGTSNHLILRRRGALASGATGGRGGAQGAPPAAPGAPTPDNSTAPRGSDVIVHDLANGHDQLLGSVGEISFNKRGDLLAYTVESTPRDGNGLFVLDLRSGRVNPLDNDSRVYSRLTWNDGGTGLAVLKGSEVERMRERDNTLLVYPNVQTAITEARATPVLLDPAKAAGFPHGFVVSDRATLDWSGDNRRLFFGVKEQVQLPDTTNRRRGPDEVADVDVWNTKDERIQSVQMTRADQDRNFTYRESFDVGNARFVKLADSTMREVEVSQDGRWAVGRDTRGYISDYKRPAADIYRINTATGERTLIAKNQLTGANVLGISPDGNYFLFWKDNKFQAYNFDAASTKTLGSGSTVSFVDMEYDHPGPRPSYGIDGYTADGKAVVARHRYDLYLVPLDGSAPTSLTKGLGAKNEIEFRYAQIEPDTSGPAAPPGGFGGGRGGRGGAAKIDLTKPITLSAYGQWTKKAGFYQLANGQLNELV